MHRAEPWRGMRTNREAAAYLGQVFDRMGLRGAWGGRFVAQKMQMRLDLHIAPDGPLSGQTKELLELTSRLTTNAQATNPQRVACLQGFLGLAQRPEAQAAFLQIMDNVPNFFDALGPEHIRTMAGQLASAPDFGVLARHTQIFKHLLEQDIFRLSGAQGKTNALSDPERALRATRMGRIPASREFRKEARQDWAAHEGRALKPLTRIGFGQRIENKAVEILQGHFEDHPMIKQMTGLSVWRGEALGTEFGANFTMKIRNYILREDRARAATSTNHSKDAGHLIFKDHLREHVEKVRIIPDNWPRR